MNCGPTYQELDLGNSGTEGRGGGSSNSCREATEVWRQESPENL